jgi:hypothetical protein
MKKFRVYSISRSCSSCTACCEGWLSGEAYGYSFSVGKKCVFCQVGGCSIYSVRPYNPCQVFECDWKRDASIPDWLIPKSSGVIIVSRKLGEYKYRSVVCMGSKELSESVLGWIASRVKVGDHFIVLGQGGKVGIYSSDSEFIRSASSI